MDPKQILARGLTHLIWRNGEVEDLHSRQAPLTDEAMKVLNKDVYNRIYSLLCMDREEVNKMAMLHGVLFGGTWDPPEEVEFVKAATGDLFGSE